MLQGQCFSCQKNLEFSLPPGFREECPQCSSDVRVCKNCEFYDAKAYNECREPQAEVIREKDRSNRCDYFSMKPPGGVKKDPKQELLSAAEALFRKK